jgi:hypothetical protein
MLHLGVERTINFILVVSFLAANMIALYTESINLKVRPMSPSPSDRHDEPRAFDQFVPVEAAMIEDVLIERGVYDLSTTPAVGRQAADGWCRLYSLRPLGCGVAASL